MNNGNTPLWRRRASDQHRFNGTLFVADDLPAFAGHFPGNPLLPGVVQIDWAISAAAETYADLPDTVFSGMSRIKFKTPVRPGSWLELELTRAADTVSFVYRYEAAICTEGRLHYRV